MSTLEEDLKVMHINNVKRKITILDREIERLEELYYPEKEYHDILNPYQHLDVCESNGEFRFELTAEDRVGMIANRKEKLKLLNEDLSASLM